MTREQTDALLDALEAKLPALLEQYPDDADFWNAFAGEAEVLTEGGDAAYAQGRIDCMLAKFELIPGDGFDPKCAPPED